MFYFAYQTITASLARKLSLGVLLLLCAVGYPVFTPAAAEETPFLYTLSSGEFTIHPQAKSVDWKILNRSNDTQSYRATFYRVDKGHYKEIIPGALTGTIEPNGSSHNANSVGAIFDPKATYLLIVEVNSLKMLPKVAMWRGSWEGELIPASVMAAEKFTRKRDNWQNGLEIERLK